LLATFLKVDGKKSSVPPRLRFKIRLQGEKQDGFNVFGLFGKVTFETPERTEIDLGRFHPIFEVFFVNHETKKELSFCLNFDQIQRYAVEKERNDGDVVFKIWLDYQLYQLGKNSEGSERVRFISSDGLWAKNAEGSDIITVEQSRWNKVLGQLGYRKSLLFELPIDFEEILSSIPTHPREGLIRRIQVATKSFQKALSELKVGKWREAVVKSRKVYEVLSTKKLEDGKHVKVAIQEMLLEYGLPKQNKENITKIIENFRYYTSPTHHILDADGNVIKEDEPTMFGREDAYLTVTTAGLLIKMLAEKLMSK